MFTQAILAALFAFLCGSCPWSIIIGRLMLRKDIRMYGDGNPGAANVFRAGGKFPGVVALILDVIKGTPGVLLASNVFHLNDLMILGTGICAILGHAFTPFLHFKGGKAVAVTYGVLLVIPYRELLIAFAIGMLAGFLLLNNDAWTVMLGPVASLGYLGWARPYEWIIQLLFVLTIFSIFFIKQYHDLQELPGYKGKLVRWLLTRK